MRTKTYIDGLKNSQRIRVLLDDFGVYTTVGECRHLFTNHSHVLATWHGLNVLSVEHQRAITAGETVSSGINVTHYTSTMASINVQINLL